MQTVRKHDMVAQNLWADRARTRTSVWAILRKSKLTIDSASERFANAFSLGGCGSGWKQGLGHATK